MLGLGIALCVIGFTMCAISTKIVAYVLGSFVIILGLAFVLAAEDSLERRIRSLEKQLSNQEDDRNA